MDCCVKTRLAGCLFSVLLVACGGGGGDGGMAPAPSGETPALGSGSGGAPASGGTGSAGPGTTPSAGGAGPATGGAPVPAAFTAFGPVAVGSSASTPFPGLQGPAVARLAGGGAVVAWMSANELLAQAIDTAGNPVGPQLQVATISPAVRSYSLAGLANGDWVIAWSAPAGAALVPPAAMQTVQTRRFSAAGALLQDTRLVHPDVFQAIDPELQVRALPDGGYLVGWAGSHAPAGSPRQALLQRFAADGTFVGDPVTVSADPGDQSRVQLVPLADGSLLVAWLQASSDGASHAIRTRRFDAAAQPVGAASELQASSGAGAFDIAATALATGNAAVLWAQPLGAVLVPLEARWQIIDPDGRPVSGMGGIAVAVSIDDLEIAPSQAGFTAFVQVSTPGSFSSSARISALAVDAGGASAGGFTTVAERTLFSIDRTAGSQSGPAPIDFAVAGAPDGHSVAVYQAGTAAGSEVRAIGQ